jgi:hypothetical protein
MASAPRPGARPAPAERMATCLEADEELMDALRESLSPLGRPSSQAVAPTGAPHKPPTPVGGEPSSARPASPTVAAYRPTLRPPMAVLTVCDDGKSDGENIRLRDGRFIIGRTEGDLIIPHDGVISSRHVEITRQAIGGQQRWVITDLQSTNGLFVRISRTLLSDQSELLVGKGRYRLLAPANEGAATADYTPPENARNTTQAWGAESSVPAIPALVEVVGNSFTNRVPLLASEYWIGTDPSCAICRPNDPFCEPRHAHMIRDAKGTWQIEQNKTVNGLWFRVPQVVCESVVQFQIGEQRFRLRAGG